MGLSLSSCLSLTIGEAVLLPDAAPERILVTGDWHGNQPWAVNVLNRVPQLLRDQDIKLVLHLGDFGIWPGREGERYLAAIEWVLDQVGAQLWFIDGNHEDFSLLSAIAGQAMDSPAIDGRATAVGRVGVRPRIAYLPRGHRWRWHGRAWLACGGGVSLDRAERVPGRDWWPQEEITAGQEAALIASGRADVMVCHDCPSGVPHRFSRPPASWAAADLARNTAHRERLQRIVDAARPKHLLHGHLHRAYRSHCDFGYGPVEVAGLAADGKLSNFAVLDVTTMTWQSRRSPRRRPRIAGIRRGPVK